jgi:hypothetical protein
VYFASCPSTRLSLPLSSSRAFRLLPLSTPSSRLSPHLIKITP